jgi:hypothetical protein
LRLPALIIVGEIVERAVQADVDVTLALGAGIVEADAFLGFDLSPAMEARHDDLASNLL